VAGGMSENVIVSIEINRETAAKAAASSKRHHRQQRRQAKSENGSGEEIVGEWRQKINGGRRKA